MGREAWRVVSTGGAHGREQQWEWSGAEGWRTRAPDDAAGPRHVRRRAGAHVAVPAAVLGRVRAALAIERVRRVRLVLEPAFSIGVVPARVQPPADGQRAEHPAVARQALAAPVGLGLGSVRLAEVRIRIRVRVRVRVRVRLGVRGRACSPV